MIRSQEPSGWRRRTCTRTPVLSVEAGASFGWSRWSDDQVAIDHFGASAPGAQVLAEFGFTPDNVADRARQLLDSFGGGR